MYKITDDNIDFILDDIGKRGVVIEDVKYNILDHVCCIIENEMKDGQDFKKFYENTIARFYKNELKEIEDETRELITFKYYHAMRRTLKVTGVISVFLCIAGAIFKFNHWPGAGILILLSLGFFGLVFIPLNIILKFKDEKEGTNKFLITFGLILGMLITIGFLFKVMHWPFANVMVFSSLGLFAFLFIPVYFLTRFRNPETKFNSIINTTFMVAGAGLMFALINTGTSRNVTRSVETMQEFQSLNIQKMEEKNSELYASFDSVRATSIEKMQSATDNLEYVITGIRNNLIAHSNKTTVEEAEKTTLAGVKDPNDNGVVKQHFADAKTEFSYDALTNAIDIYNKEIQTLDENNILRPIDISMLQMQETILSVVLLDLEDIHLQALSNENSYLCLQSGLIANN